MVTVHLIGDVTRPKPQSPAEWRTMYLVHRNWHIFAKQWANEFSNLISGDALAVFSSTTIGPDVIWEGDHPNRRLDAHKEQWQGGRGALFRREEHYVDKSTQR